MKRLVLALLVVMLRSAVGLCEESSPKPYVKIQDVPFVAKMGEPFQITVELVPASRIPVEVRLTTSDITYSESRFRVEPGQAKRLNAKIFHTQTGLAWVHATATGYDEAWFAIDTGYRGRLKLSSTGKLSYENATALAILIVDPDGKPLSVESTSQTIRLESADALLFSGSDRGHTLALPLTAGATMSPQIQIKPTSRSGGNIHLSASLILNEAFLAQESYTLEAQPAVWLPLVLAIAGALLHSVYKISRLSSFTVWGTVALLIASAVAGCVGYMTASFDLFGLKLDPNVLRTYPLIGFLFSYFGVEVLLSNKLSPHPKAGATPPVPQP